MGVGGSVGVAAGVGAGAGLGLARCSTRLSELCFSASDLLALSVARISLSAEASMLRSSSIFLSRRGPSTFFCSACASTMPRIRSAASAPSASCSRNDSRSALMPSRHSTAADTSLTTGSSWRLSSGASSFPRVSMMKCSSCAGKRSAAWGSSWRS